MAYKKPQPRTEAEWRAFKDWLAHPVEAVKDWFGATPDDWQGDLLQAIFTTTDRAAIKAAHGPGKTAVFSWAGLIFLNCLQDSRLVATAPTFAQLHDVLFPEMARWLDRMPARIKDEWVTSGGHIRHKANPMVWFGVARTSNKPENLQGFHGTDLMIMGDEASGIKQPTFEVMEGALSEAGEEGKTAKLIIAGNPNFNSGELHDAFYRNRDLYERITVTGDPDLLKMFQVAQGGYHQEHGRIYYSKRVKQKYVKTIEKKYGKDSAVYDVRVRGLFPRVSDDAIFPLEWVERAMELEPPPFDPVADPVTLVVDPSRGGAAETAIGRFRRGIPVKLAGHKTITNRQTVNLVHEEVMAIRAEGLRLAEIIVDEPGVGGGIIDDLRADFNYPVRPYNGSKPMVKGVDPEDECRMFLNRRARDHWMLRRKIEVGGYPLPNDEVLQAQMASLQFHYTDGQEKIQVESKQDLKSRLGPDASPDRSDVIVMGSAPWYGSAATVASISEDDIACGEDRDTTSYAEDMEAGLV